MFTFIISILNDVYYVSLIEFNQLYYHQNINEPVASSTMNDLSLWIPQSFLVIVSEFYPETMNNFVEE